jgi:hypothetical protein
MSAINEQHSQWRMRNSAGGGGELILKTSALHQCILWHQYLQTPISITILWCTQPIVELEFRNVHKKNHRDFKKSEVFTVMKIQVAVFCVVKTRSDVGYQRFEGPCCLHLYFTLKMEVRWYSETSASYDITTRRHMPSRPRLESQRISGT